MCALSALKMIQGRSGNNRKLLTSPSKIASTLEWRASQGAVVLAMNVMKDRLDLAIAAHPGQTMIGGEVDDNDFENEWIQPLPSIPVKTQVTIADSSSSSGNDDRHPPHQQQHHHHHHSSKRALDPSVSRELSSILREQWKNQVCGVVVRWPLQPEGWCGASAGRVLFTLDQLAESLPQSLLWCVWNDQHTPLHDDEWGRNPVYARIIGTSTTHWQSSYNDDAVAAAPAALTNRNTNKYNNQVLVNMWNDFCANHWPDLYCENSSTASSSSSSYEHYHPHHLRPATTTSTPVKNIATTARKPSSLLTATKSVHARLLHHLTLDF